MYTPESDLPRLPPRRDDAHKGDFGLALIVGGSRGMAGAPCLTARGACRGGAGLVRVAVPEAIWDIVAAKLDECLTDGFPSTPRGACCTGPARRARSWPSGARRMRLPLD
jgi:NAD(P)H-hydrate epimerase